MSCSDFAIDNLGAHSFDAVEPVDLPLEESVDLDDSPDPFEPVEDAFVLFCAPSVALTDDPLADSVLPDFKP